MRFRVSLFLSLILSLAFVKAQSGFELYAEEYNNVLKTSVNDYLYGSMVVPAGDSVSTIVLIVSDAGNTDKDGNTRLFRNFALQKLAYSLAENNIASLRYDKRGVGASRATSSNLDVSFDDYVRDAMEWTSLLKHDGRFKNIVLLGHGQGGLVSLTAMGKGLKVDGLVLLNMESRSYGDAIKRQYENHPFLVKDVVFSLVDSLNQGYEVDFVPFFLTSSFSHERQNFARSIMRYDPISLIKSVRVPILTVGGNTDIEVNEENAVNLANANKRARCAIIDGMNHVLKNCYTLDRDFQRLTYANPARPINRNLVDCICEFLKSNKL